jgi:serine/threonine protein kinase
MPTPSFLPSADPLVGRVLKETYHLDRKLDEGGAGAVYVGTHLGTDRMVAVKILQGLRAAAPEVCARFFHEARILSRLDHPNIVELLDFDFTPEGLPFLVMGYMEGCTLDAFVPEGGLPLRTVAAFMQQILEGVGAAHEAGLVHRDLSPYNLFVADPTGTPQIKVLNFGVAKALNDSGAKTLDNHAFGNPNYMSPEHFRNFEGMDARADIFSLGAVLHFLLTGTDPFQGASFPAAMAKVLSGQKPAPIDFTALEKPEAAVLEPLIRRAMDPNPDLRFASTEEMREALREAFGRIVSPSSSHRPRRGLPPFHLRHVGTFALGASPLILITGAFLAWQLSQPPAPLRSAAGHRTEREDDLAAFQRHLREVVRSRDANTLLSLVAPEARSPEGKGPEGVAAAWHPEAKDASLWSELDQALDRSALEGPGRFEARSGDMPQSLHLSATRGGDGTWRIDGLTRD